MVLYLSRFTSLLQEGCSAFLGSFSVPQSGMLVSVYTTLSRLVASNSVNRSTSSGPAGSSSWPVRWSLQPDEVPAPNMTESNSNFCDFHIPISFSDARLLGRSLPYDFHAYTLVVSVLSLGRIGEFSRNR